MITGKRLNSYKKHFKKLKGKTVLLGAPKSHLNPQQLDDSGLGAGAAVGSTILPADVGPITHFNSEGKEIVHKDQPKESVTRQAFWTWKEWHGPYTETRTKIVDIPYKRYPRTFVAPPALEIKLTTDVTGVEQVIVNTQFVLGTTPEMDVLHAANLLLELFGTFQIYDKDLNALITVPLQRLNWRLLPQGVHPWATLKSMLQTTISKASPGNQTVVEQRFETVNGHAPDFVAVGAGGFSGYVVFAFPAKNLYVLESTRVDNATYIFQQNWQVLSQLTKADILNNNLHHDRIIHRDGWFDAVKALLQ